MDSPLRDTEGGLPEWQEFLDQMAPRTGLSESDCQSWDEYRTATIGLCWQELACLGTETEVDTALNARGIQATCSSMPPLVSNSIVQLVKVAQGNSPVGSLMIVHVMYSRNCENETGQCRSGSGPTE